MKHRIEETYAIHVAYTKCAVGNVWGILFLLETFQADPVPAFIMLPHGIYPRIPPNEQPTKRLECPGYKIKPLCVESGACFYCWELLAQISASAQNPPRATSAKHISHIHTHPHIISSRIPPKEQPTKRLSCPGYKIKPLWVESGACFYCWELLGQISASTQNPPRATSCQTHFPHPHTST
jgi:hypothetical protein